MRSADDLFKKCERDGEETVRKRLAEKVYCTHDEIPIIQEWLRLKDEERSLASSFKRDAREEETLAIAKEANSFAREANSIAREANSFARRSSRKDRIIAITAIIIAAIVAREDIIWIISWLLKQITKSP